MIIIKKLLVFLLVLSFFQFSAFAVEVSPPQIKSKSAVLYDTNGNKLLDISGDEKLTPASVTKILTMLIIMQEIEAGRLKYDDLITTSAYASSMGGTQVFLKEGEQMTLDHMLKAIAVASANDAAVAVAEHISGSEEAFVALMNQTAKELGMTNSNFVNANGLDINGKITTTSANDLALASVALLKYPKIVEYTSIWMDTLRDGKFGLANTNKMLKSYSGLYGLKTGFTSEAKYCISAAAKKEGLDLIAVVMKADTKEIRNADVSALLNYGFANFKNYDASYKGEINLNISGGKKESIKGEIKENTTLLIKKNDGENIKTELVMFEDLKAPILKDQKIGEYKIFTNDVLIKSFDVLSKESVEALSLWNRFSKMLKIIFMQKNI